MPRIVKRHFAISLTNERAICGTRSTNLVTKNGIWTDIDCLHCQNILCSRSDELVEKPQDFVRQFFVKVDLNRNPDRDRVTCARDNAKANIEEFPS